MKVLLITHDRLGERMAGPAIRNWELAAQLARQHQVTLTSLQPTEAAHPLFSVTSFHGITAQLKEQAAAHDILLVQGLMLHRFPFLARLGKYLIVDLYDPFIFESYPFYLESVDGTAAFTEHWNIQNRQMELADFTLCASDRQRDLWLGRFCALGRLTPELYRQDPAFRHLIDIVPFGLPEVPPRSTRRVIKGVVPGIDESDFLLIWGGGIWNWFDPLSVIRAVAKLGETRSDIKLFFMGTGQPNPELPEMSMYQQALSLAEELKVKDRLVFFNEGWVPYHERQNYLLEADAAVSSHFDSIETRFSFRTRVLDYLWAGLPILTSDGDSMAELVRQERLGLVLPVRDVEAWQEAILKLRNEPEAGRTFSANIQTVAPRFAWSHAAKPLLDYCQAPYHTPKNRPSSRQTIRHWGELSRVAWETLRQAGPTGVARKVFSRLERMR